MTPVNPTTSIHIVRTMPSRLCRSSHLMVVQAMAPDFAEVELAHRGAIDDDAGHDRDDEQQAHEPEEQLSGEAGIQIDVQLEHDVGEAAGEVRRIEIVRGMRIDADETIGRGIDVDGFADRQEKRVVLMRVPYEEVGDLPRRAGDEPKVPSTEWCSTPARASDHLDRDRKTPFRRGGGTTDRATAPSRSRPPARRADGELRALIERQPQPVRIARGIEAARLDRIEEHRSRCRGRG